MAGAILDQKGGIGVRRLVTVRHLSPPSRLKRYKTIIILWTMLAPLGCRAQSPGTEPGDSLSEAPFYERDFATQAGEGRVVCSVNEDSTYVLCKRSLTNNVKIPHPIRAYAVYDLQDQEKTYSGRIDGDVRWYDKHTIHVQRLQRVGGAVANQQDYNTYVDVRSGKPTLKPDIGRHRP